jgi:hypothetical protein
LYNIKNTKNLFDCHNNSKTCQRRALFLVFGVVVVAVTESHITIMRVVLSSSFVFRLPPSRIKSPFTLFLCTLSPPPNTYCNSGTTFICNINPFKILEGRGKGRRKEKGEGRREKGEGRRKEEGRRRKEEGRRKIISLNIMHIWT